MSMECLGLLGWGTGLCSVWCIWQMDEWPERGWGAPDLETRQWGFSATPSAPGVSLNWALGILASRWLSLRGTAVRAPPCQPATVGGKAPGRGGQVAGGLLQTTAGETLRGLRARPLAEP